MIDQGDVALISVIVTVLLGLMQLGRAWKQDKVTEKTGIVTTTGDSVDRIMRGFTGLNDSLQKEVERADRRYENLEQRRLAEAEECKREINLLKAALVTATNKA